MPATDLYLIRKNQQWVKFSAVLGLTVTGPTTADEIEVWSGEYRDIFSSSLSVVSGVINASEGVAIANPSTYSAPGMISSAGFVNSVSGPPATTTSTFTPTAAAPLSDETAHEPLRQTALKRTCWKFDYGAAATPRYGYAFVMDGDIVANNPPETV
jgi:hypothetical protein